MQAALARALRDPDLQIAYWLPGARRYIDATGQPVLEPTAGPGRTITRLTRDGRPIAAISHAGAAPGLDSHLGPAIGLGLENERLQAELLAQLGELRASRTRIVEAADAERRRLERDLHDGAQQRLLALSYDIRLARASAEADGDTLRQTTLADTAPRPVHIHQADTRRCPAPVEAAAYYTDAEAVADAASRGADRATVTVTHEGGRLVITVEDTGTGRAAPMIALTDRVGALGGSVLTPPTACQAEIPCALS